MSELVMPVIVALIAAGPPMLVAMSGRRHAKGANEAVNCRPPGAPSLADDVRHIASDMRKMRAEHASDMREIRTEQASLAVIVGEHMANGG